ncbi:uncharacterized protein LOC143447380 isoform X2 [Clavelina lepadiformis]|uniref:uncharacterized protein LOC143447380 isoform X2 n=1 Tax=Clavelina lepadiformis TaxID=159417 RepID=UPI004040FF62
MELSEFLKKHLQGYTEDGNYCNGKYVGCINSLVESFMAVTNCVFRRVSAHHRGSSKRLMQKEPKARNLWFSHTNSLIPIPFNGYLFEILSTETWNCTFGRDNHGGRLRFKGGKRKLGNDLMSKCSAAINIRTIKVYPDFVVRSDGTAPENKKEQESVKQALMGKLKENIDPPSKIVCYCRFPLLTAHTNHDLCEATVITNRMDKRIANKIKELARGGIYDVDSMQTLIYDYVKTTLFALAAAEELPHQENTRYFPTKKMIQQRMASVVGSLKKRKQQLTTEHNTASSFYASPVVKEIVLNRFSEEPVISASSNIGLIAVHAGAGYHSDHKWPGYQNICQQACVQAASCLKNGGSAGEAVMIAVKVLEDSEFTNAGFGSNLTESGSIECDASVMDASLSPDSSVKFGAVSGVACVKNPACAAYEIARQQTLHPRLALGRIPPCVLSGHGAENWARAHGLEMCEKNDLVSESALKTWQKYHRKILEHLTRHHEVEDSLDEDVLSERFDTVGAVAMDKNGRVASAASSGGLLMKLPGRIGQAGMYGCGTWAENGTATKPAVAVTSSGCGEQLMYTLAAKKCSENLQGSDEPYMAVQHTLLEDFLNSPILNGDRDRQGGLLALHSSKDSAHSTTEIVWGHTTSSMLVAHMSTRDSTAEVILSRLPDSAVPGKSVSVSGTWIKVDNSVDESPCTSADTSNSVKLATPEMEIQFDQSLYFSNNTSAASLCKVPPKSQVDGANDDFSLDNDITFMYLSADLNGLSTDQCQVKMSEVYNRKIENSFEKTICSKWKKRQLKNPRDYMETNWSPDIEYLQEIGRKQHTNSQAFLSDPLGVAGILTTSDNLVVFQRRNHWVAEGANQLDVPGGHPEPSEVVGDGKQCGVDMSQLHFEGVLKEIFTSPLKEIRDEVNLPIAALSEPRLMGIARNRLSGGRAVCYFLLKCSLTSDEIVTSFSKGGLETDESTELVFIPDEDVVYLERDSKNFWSELCPNGKAAVSFYSILNQMNAGKTPFQKKF